MRRNQKDVRSYTIRPTPRRSIEDDGSDYSEFGPPESSPSDSNYETLRSLSTRRRTTRLGVRISEITKLSMRSNLC